MKASLLGCLWGLGHSTGQLILGLLMVILKDRFNSLVPALAKWGGTSVGLSLVCIGVMGLMELRGEAQADQPDQLSSQAGVQEAQPSRLHGQPAYAAGGMEQPLNPSWKRVQTLFRDTNQHLHALCTFLQEARSVVTASQLWRRRPPQSLRTALSRKTFPLAPSSPACYTGCSQTLCS